MANVPSNSFGNEQISGLMSTNCVFSVNTEAVPALGYSLTVNIEAVPTLGYSLTVNTEAVPALGYSLTVNTEAVPALSYSFISGQVGYCGYLIIM